MSEEEVQERLAASRRLEAYRQMADQQIEYMIKSGLSVCRFVKGSDSYLETVSDDMSVEDGIEGDQDFYDDA